MSRSRFLLARAEHPWTLESARAQSRDDLYRALPRCTDPASGEPPIERTLLFDDKASTVADR
jgi:hypothetical protein